MGKGGSGSCPPGCTTFRQAIVTAGIGALRVAVAEALDPLSVGA
jgi:hypothetical protein